MSSGAEDSGAEAVPLFTAYVESLRIHALMLISFGYKRMTPAKFATAEEDTITGELSKEMKAVLEDEDAPQWAERYEVGEQVRANTGDKEGKERPIVDVEFVQIKRGRRFRLRFEAKRLGVNHSAGNYFGDGGLEAFVTGYYDRTHDDAGMLGYVQSLSEDEWTDKLRAESKRRTSLLGITQAWKDFSCVGCPAYTFHTEHRDKNGLNLAVYHVLLGFL